jgi:NAD(P)-dependent dehydrogenase (short-subunit alcohol dehydrogenase family)
MAQAWSSPPPPQVCAARRIWRPYTASKHAVVGLMRTAALESAARGIRVNTIHPAMVDSPMIERLEAARAKGRTLAEVRRRFEQTIPMGRYIAPDEVAELVAFLAGPESRMITGATYLVDGGAMLL